MNTFFSEFTTGLLAPWRGTELILSKPRVLRFAILPFIITTIVFLAGLGWGFSLLAGWIPSIATMMMGWFGMDPTSFGSTFLYWTIIIAAWPFALFALVYFLFLLARLIAAPFYALLAEQVLIETGALADRPFQFGEWLRVNARLFGVALVKVGFFALIGIVLFILSFIPGLGLLTGFGFLLIAAYDIIDISLEALQLGFRQRFQFFRARMPAFLGFACVLGLVFLVPGLNFFLFPAAVAGGSDVVRRLKNVEPIAGANAQKRLD